MVKIDLFIWNGGLFVGEWRDNDDDLNLSDMKMKKNRRSESKAAAARLMGRVQGLRQKIARKSILLEVQVSTNALFLFFQKVSTFSLRNSSHEKPVNSNPKINILLSPLSN